MRLPWSRRRAPAPQPTALISIADPTLAAYFSPGGGLVDLAGVQVSEFSILGLTAMFRAVSLISGTLASLPLRTLSEPTAGEVRQVGSVFDEPDGPDHQTQFEWEETLFAHLVIHGKAGALKVRNEAGGLLRLALVHPLSFWPEEPTLAEYRSGNLPAGGIWFKVALNNGSQVRLDARDFWYVPALSLNGIHGLGLLQVARTALSTSIAGDRAAARMFSNGALISGLATPEDDFEPEELPQMRAELDRGMTGYENAGGIALVNRRLKFTPWTMSAVDAQFLQSRQFQIEEVSRMTGVPPHLLMQTEKQTSWGTGVEEQNRALGRTVLNTWATRFEQRGARLLPRPRRLSIDFMGLERPSPDREIELDLSQVAAGVMTVDEYRARRGLGPLPAGAAAPAGEQEGGDDDPTAE